jgi:DNA polymerase-3 subunit delta
MKINLSQLKPHLSKSLSPIYIVSGEEPWQKDFALKQIRQAALIVGFTERQRITLETHFEVESLYHALFAISLLSEKKLVELDMRDTTPNKATSALLQDYAKQPVADVILLILMGKIDDKIVKSAWYTAIEKSATVIPIWPISREQLPKWLIQQAHSLGLTLKPDAATLLAEYVEGNLVAAVQTLEKLNLLNPPQPIDRSMLHPILTNESQFNVFDLIDSLLANPPARSLAILHQLKLNDVEPAIVLWSIARELRLLAEAATMIEQGTSLETIFKKHRVFPRRQPVIKAFLARTNAKACYHYLKQAIYVDDAIKGGSSHDPWQALVLLCLRMTNRLSLK